MQLAVAMYTEYSKTKAQRVCKCIIHRRTCWTNKLDKGCITHHMSLHIFFFQFTLTYRKSTLRLFSFIMSVLPFYIVCQIKN